MFPWDHRTRLLCSAPSALNCQACLNLFSQLIIRKLQQSGGRLFILNKMKRKHGSWRTWSKWVCRVDGAQAQPGAQPTGPYLLAWRLWESILTLSSVVEAGRKVLLRSHSGLNWLEVFSKIC